MSVGRHSNKKTGANTARVSFGTFTLNGNQNRARLEITKRLESYDFPHQSGEEVTVELVIPETGPSYLEVYPFDEE